MMTTLPFDPRSLVGQSFYKGMYVIDKLVDEGGFSYLYRGHRRSSQAPVAIKVLKAKSDSESERHLEEACRQREAHQKSDAIVEVYEILPASDPDNEIGKDLFVMEWVEGRNLNTPPEELERMPPRQRLIPHLKIALDIARGLEALHREGCCHGDLTPGNVLAYYKDVDGWGAKLIDLGLSRERSYWGRTAGTALYMAPEQVKQDQPTYDHLKADLYALGAVLFTLFAGRHYLQSLSARQFGETLTTGEFREITGAILNEPAQQLKDVASYIPEDLSELVAGLLEKDPAKRIQTIGEARACLEEIYDTQKQAARPSVKTQKLGFADLSRWDVRLLVYREEAGQLSPDLFPLGYLESGQPKRLDSPALWLAGGQETAHIVLIENETRQTIAAYELKPARQPYQVFFELQPDGSTRFYADSIERYPLAVENPLAAYKPIPIQEEEVVAELAFLIDGTMAADALELARNFALWTAHEVSSTPMPVRLGCVIYGEYSNYPHPPHRRRRIPYEVRSMDFAAYDDLYDYLNQQAQYSDQFMQQDWADAMELGLQCAGKLSWQSGVRYLVIVGNSPPHPTAEERERYRLLDFTTDEFRNIRWQDEVAGLKESGKLTLFAYFIKPTIGLDEEQEDYIGDIWTALDDNRPAARRELSSSRLEPEIGKLVETIRRQRRMQRVLTAPARLPLLVEG